MPTGDSKYGPAVQTVDKDASVADVIHLLKRDGGVYIKGLVAEKDVDRSSLAPAYTRTQLMNPLYHQVCEHFLTTRSWFWWGDERKESVSKPYVHSCTAMRIGPGGKAQPLHRDDYISHNNHEEISEWNDERDERGETAIGLFVAGSRITKENGGTQFIPKSHLWGTNRNAPPKVGDCIFSDMHKGDAFIMLASAYHGGGANVTKDEYRLLFSTFSVRGYLRQEENQFLTVPREKAKEYEEDIQRYMGCSISDPACGYVDEMDPMFLLRPERKTGPLDF